MNNTLVRDNLYLRDNLYQDTTNMNPTVFFKNEGDIVIASVCPSVRPSVMLSPPKPLGKIQPNLVYELLT